MDHASFLEYIKKRYLKEVSEADVLADVPLKNLMLSFDAGRKQGIEEAVKWLTEQHGKALGKHNYYAHAALSIKGLKKK
jgi:hypothetical protein